MGTELENKVERLTDSLDKLVNSTSRGSGASAPLTGDSGGFGWLKPLGAAASSTTDNLIKLSTGSYRAADALNLVTQASGAFGPLGDFAGKVTGKLGNAAITINDYGNSIGNSGMRLNNDIGLLQKSVTGARMTLPEWENTIKTSGKSLSGLSSNYDQSGLLFLNTAKKVQETGLANQLQATGMSSEEFGKILTLVAHNARAGDLTRESTQKLVVASAIKLATEFDNTARMTGISIEEQRKSLQAQTQRKDVELAMMAMSETERAALEQNLAMTKRYGDTVQDATRIMALGGPANAEEQKIVASLTPEMQDAVRRMAEVQGTGKEADDKRELIRKEMDNIVLRQVNDKANSEQASIQMRAGNDQTKAMAAATLEQNRYAQTLQKAEIESKRAGMTREQYMQAQLEKTGQFRKDAAAGTVAPESQVGVGLNKLDRLGKDAAAGLGVGVDSLNKEIGKSVKGFESLNTVLRPWTQEQASKFPTKVGDFVKGQTGVTKTAVPESAAKAAGTTTTPKPLERQDGSFGAVGKFIEDFGKGTPAILHGKEGVITEKQFNELFGAVSSRNAAPTKSNVEPQPQLGLKKDPAKSNVEPQPQLGLKKDPANIFASVEKQINNTLTTFSTLPSIISKMPNTFNEKTFKQLLGNSPTLPKISASSVDKPMGGMINSLQSNLSLEIEKNKSSMPKLEDFHALVSKIESNVASSKEKSLDIVPSVSTNTELTTTEVKDQLIQLNTVMSQLLSHTASMANNTEQQVRVTRSLSGNMLS